MTYTYTKNPVNDFALQIATVNGSGSQSANQILVRTLFRMGVPVSGKNLFPSNIQGLPTWFSIRGHPKGFVSRQQAQDLVVTLNPATAVEDQKDLRSGGLFLFSQDCKLDLAQLRQDIVYRAIPFRELSQRASDSVKTRKLLQNMIYVGILAQYLKLDLHILEEVLKNQFGKKTDFIESNQKAIQAGIHWSEENLKDLQSCLQIQAIPHGNQDYLLMDGNTAAALGLLFGGCTLASWYPITPSSSLMESLQSLATKWRRDQKGKSTCAILQAEDELAALSMVIGAGWAGARAVTATSGPGLSLMAEAAGLAYFAEVPAVIWDVQRVGPSTGLPTRTMQGDVLSAAKLSHGDTQHVLLFPSHPAECFEFGQTALDLAETLQSLVIVLSDLDLGMNLHRVQKWPYPTKPFQRGKILKAQDLESMKNFSRYADPDGDGLPYRTLPGTAHPLAAYFTRGTGHDEQARYTESPEVFKKNMDRLRLKWETAKKLVPQPIVEAHPDVKIGLLAYGTSDHVIPEVRALFKNEDQQQFNYIRLRAYPFSETVRQFLESHEQVFVVEQNRDGQLRALLSEDFPDLASRLVSILNYDGWPLTAQHVVHEIRSQISSKERKV